LIEPDDAGKGGDARNFHDPLAESVLPPMLDGAIDPHGIRRRQIPHYSRIGGHRRERRAIIVTPFA
jgi:hypothetical protein